MTRTKWIEAAPGPEATAPSATASTCPPSGAAVASLLGATEPLAVGPGQPATEPRPPLDATRAARATGLAGHARNLGQLLGSHLGVALAGVAALPLLARNLGPAAYGQFSLFMTTLGVLSNLDLARPILVRDLARAESPDLHGARVLAVTSAHALAAVAFVVGFALQGAVMGAALALAVLAHGATAASYAQLSAAGKVGLAGSVRNVCWAGALVATVAASFYTTAPLAYLAAFTAANVVILVGYQRLLGAPIASLRVRPRVGALREHAAAATDIGLFAGASAVVASSDKLILQGHATGAEFGHYAAQYDLATKINIVSTALGSMLLPSLARSNEVHGHDTTATRFVRAASWITLVYFVGIAALIGLHREFAALVFGAEFTRALGREVYPLMLVGVFVHLFGFLLTSYQRARGDYRTQRIAYLVSAGLMLTVGALAIPAYGAGGAVATYLTGRVAELALIAVEVRRMPRVILPRWRVASLTLMIATLVACAAAVTTGEGAPR